MELTELLGIELPIVQAPMAVAQDSAMAIAVSNAGGLGSLPCAMLTADGLRKELESIKSQTNKPINVNFFCHGAPDADAERESAWRAALAPYYRQFGIDPAGIPTGPGRAPFSAEFADLRSQVIRQEHAAMSARLQALGDDRVDAVRFEPECFLDSRRG